MEIKFNSAWLNLTSFPGVRYLQNGTFNLRNP